MSFDPNSSGESLYMTNLLEPKNFIINNAIDVLQKSFECDSMKFPVHYFQKTFRHQTVRFPFRRRHKFNFPDFSVVQTKGGNEVTSSPRKLSRQSTRVLAKLKSCFDSRRTPKYQFRTSNAGNWKVIQNSSSKKRFRCIFVVLRCHWHRVQQFRGFAVCIRGNFPGFSEPKCEADLSEKRLERCRWRTRHRRIACILPTTNKSPNKSVLTKY